MFQETPGQPVQSSLADIVREETDDGRLIVRFLIDLMQGGLENAKACHRLDAARQLLNIGFAPAHAFIIANTSTGRSVRRQTAVPSTDRSDSLSLHQDLAALICEETDNGRAAVRFLVDVMLGNIDEFKPHHRLYAARELLRRGFDSPVPDPASEDNTGVGDSDKSCDSRDSSDVSQPATSPDGPAPFIRRYNRYQQDYGPFDFRTYGESDYMRECYGGDALQHIFGSDEAVRVASWAVEKYRRRVAQLSSESQQPIPPDLEWSAVPADAPLPEDIYGYQALLYIFGSEGAARVAAHAGRLYRIRLLQTFAPQLDNCEDSAKDPDSSDLPDHENEHPPPESPSGLARISLDGSSFALDSTTHPDDIRYALRIP